MLIRTKSSVLIWELSGRLTSEPFDYPRQRSVSGSCDAKKTIDRNLSLRNITPYKMFPVETLWNLGTNCSIHKSVFCWPYRFCCKEGLFPPFLRLSCVIECFLLSIHPPLVILCFSSPLYASLIPHRLFLHQLNLHSLCFQNILHITIFMYTNNFWWEVFSTLPWSASKTDVAIYMPTANFKN